MGGGIVLFVWKESLYIYWEEKPRARRCFYINKKIYARRYHHRKPLP